MMKKRLLTILLSAAMSLTLVFSAGCNLVEKEKTPEEVDKEMEEILKDVDLNADENYTGTLKILYQEIPTENSIVSSFLDAFKAKYKNITIEKMPMVENNYLTLLPQQHADAVRREDYSAMPDVLWTTNEVFGGWIEKDMLMPIDYFDKKDEKFSVADTVIETMVQDSTLGDHLYMMPRDYDQIVMYYNRELLAKAGIAESRIPADRALNHDEFDSLMRDIRKAFSGMSGTNPLNNKPYRDVYAVDAVWPWASLCWPTLKSFGGSVVADNGEIDFDTPENIAAVTYLRELIKGKIIPGLGATKHANFINQLSPLCFESRAVLTELIDGNKTGGVAGVSAANLGVAPMPNLGVDEHYAIGTGCSGYSMYRHAENKTAAWLFLKFMIGEDGQNAFSETGNGVPANKNMLMNEDATWRNLTAEKFKDLKDFNHDAFVYKYDTAACTLQDFKLKIKIINAREPISKQMASTVQNCLKNTSNDNYKTEIARYFSQAEETMAGLLEAYGD